MEFRRAGWPLAGAIALGLMLTAPPDSHAAKPPPAAAKPEKKKREVKKPPPARRRQHEPAPVRKPRERRRRTIEEVQPSLLRRPPREGTLHRVVTNSYRCDFRDFPKLRKRLLKMRNKLQLMSLEVWGDERNYRVGQPVLFYFRSPRRAYVTLFWIGPKGEIVVPIENERIPGNRNVSLDSGGIIVPPLGRERWVAISTLEKVRIPCRGDEAAMLRAIDRFERIPHGVGRWEVVSRR